MGCHGGCKRGIMGCIYKGHNGLLQFTTPLDKPNTIKLELVFGVSTFGFLKCHVPTNKVMKECMCNLLYLHFERRVEWVVTEDVREA